MDKKLTLGIITYQRFNEIKSLLESLLGSEDYLDEVLIGDNNEDRGLFSEYVLQYVPDSIREKIRTFSFGNNLGVGEARDYLFRKAKGGVLLFLDDDIEFRNFKDSAKHLLQIFSSRKAEAVAFKIISASTGKVNPLEFPHRDKTLIGQQHFYTYYVIGAAFAVDLEYLRRLGINGFPKLPSKYGMEEIGLAWYIINARGRILYDSALSIVHLNSPKGRFKSDEQLYMVCLNRLFLVNSHLSLKYKLTNRIVWSLYYFRSTLNISRSIGLLFYRKKDNNSIKFSNNFYNIIKDLGGRIRY